MAKYLLAGADVVMTTSALLRHGSEHAAVLLDGLSEWMQRKGFAPSTICAGSSRWRPDADGDAHERASYVGALRNANSSAYGPS